MGIVQIVLCGLLATSVKGSTHWVVTEDGKVQEQLESPFVINQPYDLVAFMKQETNYAKMQEFKEVLVVEKKRIDKNEDNELDLEEKHFLNDEDCIAAGKRLTEFDLFVSSVLPLENKEIEVSDFIDFTKPDEGVTLHKPDCVKMPKLASLSAKYDDLEGVANRKNLELYQAEVGVKSTLKYMENVEELANAIDSALKKNSSSWVAYNLAALYWRMKGNAEQAMECVRRAIFFSPHQYKDVALVSLANILHRSRYSINASVVLEEALKISDTSIIHFALGNIYSILGDLVRSMQHYDKTLEGQPDFSAAKKRLHAVKCYRKLQLKLEAQHQSLERTLWELEAYKEKHKKFVEMYQTIENMQLSKKEQINMHLLSMKYLVKKGKFDQRLCKFRSDPDNGSPIMSCNLPGPSTDLHQNDVELIPNINTGKKQGKKNEQDVRGHVPDAKPTTFASGDNVGIFQEPEQFENIAIGDWRDPNWPTEDMCSKNAPRNLAWDEFPSTYINPEARGFPVRELLTSYIGVKEGENVPQPWSELNCESLEPVCEKTFIDEIQGIMDRHSAPMHKQDLYVKRELLLHLNEGQIWPGDFAHRINIAIKKSLQEKDKDKNLWVLYNIAGLYFRVYGDNLKAVECIRRGLRRTPKEHSDIPLVNVANIMYRLGKINDALSLLVDTLYLNRTEPLIYLTIGNVLQAKGNVSGAVTFYQYGQYLDNHFQANFWAMLNVKCATVRERALNNHLKTKDSNEGSAKAACGADGSPLDGQSVLMDNIRSAKNSDGRVFKTEQTSDEMKMYTVQGVHAFSSQETKVNTECENSSDETDLVRRLESTKEDADKILHDADAVIQRLSHVAEDSSEELSLRVSSARKIMQQLSQMRENLGSLVEEASSTLDTADTLERNPHKEQLSHSECAHALHNVDLRSYFSSDMNIDTRAYDFGEELPSPGVKSPGTTEPFCFPPSTSEQYNVDDLETVINRAKFVSYDKEYGMELLLKQLIPSDSGNQDFSVFIRQLSEGMMQHPTSWRLAFLSSYYWRLKGKAKEAIDCLRLSLSTVPLEMRDVVLLGLSNVFAQLSQWKDAIHVTDQALLLYPDYFLYHFTLANIFAAMGDVHSSIPHFRRALQLQRVKRPGDREIAQRRLEAAVCEVQRTGIH